MYLKSILLIPNSNKYKIVQVSYTNMFLIYIYSSALLYCLYVVLYETYSIIPLYWINVKWFLISDKLNFSMSTFEICFKYYWF